MRKYAVLVGVSSLLIPILSHCLILAVALLDEIWRNTQTNRFEDSVFLPVLAVGFPLAMGFLSGRFLSLPHSRLSRLLPLSPPWLTVFGICVYFWTTGEIRYAFAMILILYLGTLVLAQTAGFLVGARRNRRRLDA